MKKYCFSEKPIAEWTEEDIEGYFYERLSGRKKGTISLEEEIDYCNTEIKFNVDQGRYFKHLSDSYPDHEYYSELIKYYEQRFHTPDIEVELMAFFQKQLSIARYDKILGPFHLLSWLGLK